MSRKKERRIKRLQRLSIWPAVVEMIITEFVIFSLTVFICALSVFGIVNTLALNMVKDCRTAVDFVNEHWETQPKEVIADRLQVYAENHSNINDIQIIKNNEIQKIIPKYKLDLSDDLEKLYKKSGVLNFIDSDYDKTFLNLMFTAEDSGTMRMSLDGKSLTDKKNNKDKEMEDDDGEELGVFLYSPKNLFKTMDVTRLITDNEYIDWATRESAGLYTISIYQSAFSNVSVCFKTVYRLNTFQFNLVATIILFFIVVLIFSGIYEITKVINLIHERIRVNKLVTTDTITGGYNKDYFIQKAQKEISRKRRNYVVVQLRLEKYRNFCTAYGLKQGENLLEEINENSISLLGKKELVAHVEKSDFVFLLEYQNEATLNIRVKNIMNILRERRGGQHLTFSAGVCPVRSHSDDISLLLTCAGIAIPKEIKAQDEIVWFNDSMKEEQVWERRIEDDMEKALENHEFQVYLQPKYSTKEEVLSAAEALVRWIHPVLGFISPGKFIPIFEKNGFILQLDDYMLESIAQLQAAWAEQGKKLVPISVNVSRAHFAEDNLAEHICSIVDKYKVPHEFIELELTESAFFDDKAVLLTTVRKLKDFGFKVSMDDFGAGYSSLNSLKELPLDIIKLDAEFFRSVDDIKRSNLIVGETISLAKKLGMEIVAEGIETREQVDFLAKQNCDLIQGFYFSKPLPVSEFEQKAYPVVE